MIGDNVAPSKEEVIMSNADENIHYPKGAGVSGSINVGGATVSGSAGVSNFPTKTVILIVGAAAVGYWLYRKYGK